MGWGRKDLVWEVGRYGTHFDGLDEADTMARKGGREGGREGGEDITTFLSPRHIPSFPPSLLPSLPRWAYSTSPCPSTS